MNDVVVLVSRLLLSVIFIVAGIGKLGAGYEATQGYMQAMGVPGMLLPLVIVAELGGGLAIAAGFLTRLTAAGLALFCVVSGLIFHFDLGDQTQSIMFMKNLAIAGGFMLLALQGAGRYSVDARRSVSP